MIQRPTLFVLAEAAEIGLPETATVPVRAFDPVLRPFIKKNVVRAVDAASARTTSKNGEHILRLAFLSCHEAAPKDLDPSDLSAVAKAYETLAAPFLPPREDPNGPLKGGAYRTAAAERAADAVDEKKRPNRRWPITVPAAVVALLGAVATVALFLVPRLMPSPGARFRKTAFGTAVGEPLTDVVVAANRGGNADARAKLLSPAVKAQIGPEAYDSLTRVADELPHVRRSGPPGTGEEAIDLALAPLFLEVNELDAKLAAKRVPAHLHVYGSGASGRPVVWVTSYFVEQREELAFDGVPVRFVWGRRLDGLNLSESGLYKARAEDWAIVSMDRLEQEFVQTLLAPLAKGAPIAPDESASETSARAELGRTASRVIAAELASVAKVSPSDAEALHRAIVQRNEIAGSLVKVGYRFPAISGIELSASTVRRATQGMHDSPRDRALLEDFLRMNDRATSYRRDVAPAVAVLIRLEEEELGGQLVEQKRLEGVATPKLGDVGKSPANRHLAAASLAMIARPQACPRLALWRLVKPLFDDSSASGAVATATAKPLLVRLNLLPRDESFDIEDTDAFMRAITAALELPPDRVRDAARETYKDLFGREPPRFAHKTLP